MTNPQPPQWLIDAIFDWVNKSMLESPPKFDNPVLAALITARFEQAVGEDEALDYSYVNVPEEADQDIADTKKRNWERQQIRDRWYTDASREGDSGK